MLLLLLVCLAFLTLLFFPDIRGIAIYLFLCAISFPLVTYASATVFWVILNVVTGSSYMTPEAWLHCAAWIGIPTAIFCSWKLRLFYKVGRSKFENLKD